MVRGCRDAPILIAYCIKGHALDAVISPLMRMLKLIAEVGLRAAIAVEYAYEHHLAPSSLATSFAAGIRRLGVTLDRYTWTTASGASLPLQGPPREQNEAHQGWLHDWRVHLRLSSVAMGAGHRHEYRNVKWMSLDEALSLKLLRSTKPGKLKAALEVLLSGGLLTRGRSEGRKGPPHNHCQWGCQVEDTEQHRYWHCPTWSASRGDLCDLVGDLPSITRCTGWFITNSGFTPAFAVRVQRHMATVVLLFCQRLPILY